MAEFFYLHIYQNFIAENRWFYLVSGLKNTLLITFFALLIGVVLGGIVGVVRVTCDKADHPGVVLRFFNKVCKVYLTVFRGTPMMVQLLIMYLVVFVVFDPGEIIVAILSFGINSGAYVAEIFRSGIMSIDPGQMEAGRSLGLPYRTTMMKIVMPQAVKNVLPALGNEFIALLKETAIVGYIGLRDVTRGADIIRSQTYDPFPPLLSAALIYLVLVMLLTKGVGILERRLAQSDRR
ncbi:MAG: amino acid ABC transporter permease [Ruthenibacterium sp.]